MMHMGYGDREREQVGGLGRHACFLQITFSWYCVFRMAAFQFRHSLGRRSLALIMPILNRSVLKTWNYRKICVSMSSCKLSFSFLKIALLLPGAGMAPILTASNSLGLWYMSTPPQNCNKILCHHLLSHTCFRYCPSHFLLTLLPWACSLPCKGAGITQLRPCAFILLTLPWETGWCYFTACELKQRG